MSKQNIYIAALQSYDTMIKNATPDTANAVLNDIQKSIKHILSTNTCIYPDACQYSENNICTQPNITCGFRNKNKQQKGKKKT